VNWSLARRTCSLITACLWTECRKKPQQLDVLSRPGLGIGFDPGGPGGKAEVREDAGRTREVDGYGCVVGWAFVGQFSGSLGVSGQFENGVYVVLLSAMDCLCQY